MRTGKADRWRRRVVVLAGGGILLCGMLVPGMVRAGPETATGEKASIVENGRRGVDWAFETLFTPTQSMISSNFVAFAERCDRMFGDERLIEEADVSRLIIGVGVRTSRFNGQGFQSRSRASLALPRTRNRVAFFWDHMTEGDDITDRHDISEAYEKSNPDAELRIQLMEAERFWLTAGGGVRLGSGAQPYLRLRGSRNFSLGEESSFYIAQTARYFSLDRAMTTSEMRLTWIVSNDWLMRVRPALDWAEKKPGYEPSLTLSAWRGLGRQRALRFDLGANWPATPHCRESLYYLQATLRRELRHDWLLGELQAGVAFPETESFRPDPYVGIMFELMFGDVK